MNWQTPLPLHTVNPRGECILFLFHSLNICQYSINVIMVQFYSRLWFQALCSRLLENIKAEFMYVWTKLFVFKYNHLLTCIPLTYNSVQSPLTSFHSHAYDVIAQGLRKFTFCYRLSRWKHVEKCGVLKRNLALSIYKMSIFHTLKCNIIFYHKNTKYKQKISSNWRLVLSTKSHDHESCDWLTVATSQVVDFGIPRLSSEQNYGISMTSVALPDDLKLRGECVNKSKLWCWTFSDFCYLYTVNPLYNDNVCSKLSLTFKWICCYKEILTSTRFPHYNHLVKENIIQIN